MKKLNYSDYIKVPELLSLQEAKSDPAEHDELLFIVIHQTYELWFKVLLQEFQKISVGFQENDLYGLIHSFKRARTVMKTLVKQMDVLETMTPLSFSSFRDRLETASGFQSYQFREIEFRLGYKREEVLGYYTFSEDIMNHLKSVLKEPSLVDDFYLFLEQNGITIPSELKKRDLSLPNEANKDIQDGILKVYQERPDVSLLFELMVDLDEGFQEWRYRHVKLVERTIGSKQGTGGSLGVEFLKKSLFQSVFPDIWAVRHRF